MSAGGRPGVATAGNGPSTGTDPPASSPGQLSAPLCRTLWVQCCPAPVPVASFTALVPVPSTGRAPRLSTGVQTCPPGKAKRQNILLSGTGAQPCTRRSAKPRRRWLSKCRDKDTAAPAQPPVAGVRSPPQHGQPGRAQPAAPHSCGAELLRWHGHTDLGCTEWSRPPNSPKNRAT